MKFVKKHLVEIIIFIIFFGIVIFGLTTFFMLWNAGSGNKYGTRLNGISKVELGDKYLNSTIMEKKTIVKEVSYRTWDEEGNADRSYSASLVLSDTSDEENKLEVGVDGGTLEVPVEDVPLLVKVLQEFC